MEETEEERKTREAAEYAAAFEGDDEMRGGSEDDAGGLPGAEPTQGKPDTSTVAAEPVATVGDAPNEENGSAGVEGDMKRQQPGDQGGDAGGLPAGDGTSGATGSEGAGSEGSAASTSAADDGNLDLDDVPGDEQAAAKSWRGRLEARERELKSKAEELDAREQALKAKPEGEKQDAIEDVADQAAATGDREMAQAANELAEQVEAGQITADEAIASLKEDFGESFVNMITTVARTAVKADVERMQADHQKDIESIADRYQREHFEAIHDAHPDAFDIAQTDEFKAWAEKNGKQDLVQNGSARQINKMLDQYKKEQAPAAAPSPAPAPAPAAPRTVPAASEDDAHAATAVRSTGIAVPPRPKQVAENDYEGSWAAH